ncbi:hypothetical protein BJ875DRAFT_501429 [Amylocarpus encephaloides]|uniref:C2H2-type domain-containing protein n=1 Tax=Amylocarpus encephaloides TaxID=45428 RepID=A0A9P7YSX6_9HELO|nr:hypothetical protein BJ875DRAFT_501429 [Amylocarpus encephaloides]
MSWPGSQKPPFTTTNANTPSSSTPNQRSFTSSSPDTIPTTTTDDIATSVITADSTLSSLLGAFTNDHRSYMDRSLPEYSQSGLPSSYPHILTNARSEEPSAELVSAAQYPQPQAAPSTELAAVVRFSQPPELPSHGFSSAPPTDFYPALARPASIPGRIQRQFFPANNHGGGMAQPPSPSLPLQDGRNHPSNQIKSDSDILDPSIQVPSPTAYASHNGQYSPYTPEQAMQHGYPQSHPGSAMYAQPRPDWSGYAGHPQMAQGGYATSGAQTPTSAASAGAPSSQVYSFVPIPGAQQHKRPRRRYEEIERMYKCGWNGCEKAYGTLNHLNAHVTMQSHGQKRTPDEFKEIRKEWKTRKKVDENLRKANEERARAQAVGGMATVEGQPSGEGAPAPGYQQPGRSVQLPSIGYQPGAHVPNQYQAQPSGNVQQIPDYNGNQNSQNSQPKYDGQNGQTKYDGLPKYDQ